MMSKQNAPQHLSRNWTDIAHGTLLIGSAVSFATAFPAQATAVRTEADTAGAIAIAGSLSCWMASGALNIYDGMRGSMPSHRTLQQDLLIAAVCIGYVADACISGSTSISTNAAYACWAAAAAKSLTHSLLALRQKENSCLSRFARWFNRQSEASRLLSGSALYGAAAVLFLPDMCKAIANLQPDDDSITRVGAYGYLIGMVPWMANVALDAKIGIELRHQEKNRAAQGPWTEMVRREHRERSAASEAHIVSFATKYPRLSIRTDFSTLEFPSRSSPHSPHSADDFRRISYLNNDSMPRTH